jgi:hypothetical protein
MTRRLMLFLSILSVLIACGPPWEVVRQATPSPLLGKKHFVLKPIDFSGLRVGEKTEQGYLAEKDEESRGNWVGDKKGMNDEFATALMSSARDNGIQITTDGEADFYIQPKVPWMEPGFYAVVAAKPSEVDMTLLILDAKGEVVDEIVMKHGTGASMTNPAVGNRLRDDAEALGGYAAEYVTSRVTGEQP